MTGLVEGGADTFTYQHSCQPAVAAVLYSAILESYCQLYPLFFSQALTNTEFHLGVQHRSGEATGVGSVAATLSTNITPPWAF